MLFFYQQTTQRILGDTRQARFNRFDLKDWINTGRSQAAAEGEAIRALGTLSTVPGTQSYAFSAIDLPNAASQGYAGVLTVRQIGTGSGWLTPREWEWFFQNDIASGSSSGSPNEWAQLGQGSLGGFYLSPTPNAVGTLTIDAVVLPAPLGLDSDPEALPYPFTDAVPFYAAFMAMLTAGDMQAAENFYMFFERFIARARAMSVPTVLPRQYPGGQPAALAGRHIGITPSPPSGGRNGSSGAS